MRWILLLLIYAGFASAETLSDQILDGDDGDRAIISLIESGEDVNALDENGFTPLTLASRMCMPKTSELLIEAGADVNKIDKFSLPPLYHALVENCAILTKILIDSGANVKWVDIESGRNFLHYASVLGADTEVIDLIYAGADINGLDSNGESPLRVLLNWKGVAPWFKEDRANLYRKYGARDVYTRLPHSQNDVPDDKKR